MKLGKLGVFTFVDGMAAPDAAAFVQRLENWGYAALWLPEAFGRDVLVSSAWLLANTKKIVIASGIANIYARDPLAMACGQKTLAEQSGGRFLLGVGVSHAPMVEGMRGHKYQAPVETMRTYLEAMAKAPYMGPQPPEKPMTVIGALGPKMLALSASHADGAHPYNVIPEHTAQARKILGAGKLLCVEQKVMLETSADKARTAARKMLAMYQTLPNYQNMWKRSGFTEKDYTGDASDRLIDAVFAWGDEKTIRARLKEHWDAGADHVCIQPVNPDGTMAIDDKVLKALAPG